MPDRKPSNDPCVPLYTCQQSRDIDAAAIAAGTPGIILMKQAGKAAFDLLQHRWPNSRHLAIFCGGGNNGGDGYIVAGLAVARGFAVKVYAVTEPEKLKGDAQRAYLFALQEGVEIRSANSWDGALDSGSADSKPLIIDGILGTGFSGEVRNDVAAVIKKLNDSECSILALDVPSGVNADTGKASEYAIRADTTITFIVRKRGLHTADGPEYCGSVVLAELGVKTSSLKERVPSATLVKSLPPLSPRAKNAHKGDAGHVLIIGGDYGMGGAAMLACESALRAGAGLVSLATRDVHVPAVLARLPEVMTEAVNCGPELSALIAKADVIAIGPGLGQTAWSQQMLRVALSFSGQKVLDADALNLIAELDKVPDLGEAVITPHPGEAARLLGCDSLTVQADRFQALDDLTKKFDCSVVLKGSGSVIGGSNKSDRFVLDAGNPGMAVAGMGDVLTGVIAALIAQGDNILDAALRGAFIHAQAGDRASGLGERGLRASDLMPFIRERMNS